MEEIQKERQRLKLTLELIKKLIENEQLNLTKLSKDFVGTKDELFQAINRKKLDIQRLQKSYNNPYFARIDFKQEDEKEANKIYIGKYGVSDQGNISVIDWRAPISSLYYDSNLGKCSYLAPAGKISGELSLKRQYEIIESELIKYFDVDLVSNDDLLQKYLNENNDNRLKNIVSTIQQEQNDIIRRSLNENLIIQGVAGSGKTTVALHRIAYLVYNYLQVIRPNQYLVIGPNDVFLKYISSVLPDLDVDGIQQLTFEKFIKMYINEDISINSNDVKYAKYVAGKDDLEIEKFKGSAKYYGMLNQFLKVFYANLTNKDLCFDDFIIIKNDIIKEIYETSDTLYDISLESKIERAIGRIGNYIRLHYDEIESDYFQYIHEKVELIEEDQLPSFRKKVQFNKKDLANGCRNALKKYFKSAYYNSTKIYKLFINSIKDFDIYSYPKINQLKKQTMEKIKNNSYDYEDLAPLLYINSLMKSNKQFKDIKFTVIDEAQDLTEFSYIALKQALPSSSFNIFGDIAQSIYDYHSVDNWDIVNKILFDNSGKIVKFNKSYRTTNQIMSAANDIAEYLNLNRSDMVIREGNPISYHQIPDDGDKIDFIIEKLEEYKRVNYKTVAIISKTRLLSSYLNDDLTFKGIYIANITADSDITEYENNICTISNQLAKGLEFDAVIIADADEAMYSSNNSLDLKLLYVAITRALHQLDIIYSNNINKVLENNLLKSSNQDYSKKKAK